MEMTKLTQPDYVFEVSWEVCNKVGGIHTVIATKARTLTEQYGDKYILIGPDVWKGGNNPEFIEDQTLFKSWKDRAIHEGLNIRIGRWNILGNPIVILVDFTAFYSQKNEILADLWVKYRLDSLTGQWDYIEPVMFGYAAARIIEYFYLHHLNISDKIIAQFHEWMTGSGVLIIKDKIPQIGTVFTTHATVLGRAIAGSGVPFYSMFDSFAADKAATDFNVVSKHSMEKIAAKTCDCFTTVSEITAKECEKFLNRKPDVITHNGFDVSILPNEHNFEKNRAAARKKVLQVASGLWNQELPEDTILVIKSGRYEYKNKGVDIFIDSLAALNANNALNKTIVGVIFIPAHQTGPRKELLERMEQPDFNDPKTGEIYTHNLQGVEFDPICLQIERLGLKNTIHDKVKIMFAPTYLDGNDGIFNMHYYDVMIGFDLAIFPSYYEPWGYTPLESIAYHIPSIGTNISGFGMAIEEQFGATRPGISIVTRTDDNKADVVEAISKWIFGFTTKTEQEVLDARADAHNISLYFLWEKLIANYEKAYNIAINRSLERKDLFVIKPQVERITLSEQISDSKPAWRSISVEADFPKELAALHKLSKNLWWCWNYEVEELFEYIDPVFWENCGHNPVLLTRQLSFRKITQLSRDNNFLRLLDAADKKFEEYMNTPLIQQPAIAYFSMEYGLATFMKLYSGGLGILAGDYLKEASDSGVNLTGVGLLYRNGYFKQKFTVYGEQIAEPDTQDFSCLPLQLITNKDQSPLLINLYFPGRTVDIQIWKLNVGRICLYLLDTDLPQNSHEDRNITAFLYDANTENRLKQEMLLGIGGIRALNALGIKPDICHCNEGHAAFLSIERITNLVKDNNLSFDVALEIAKSSTLFTTHTSVPAANDIFSEDLLRKYFADNIHFFNIPWNKFMGLGRENANDSNEQFSMTYYGARIAQEINAVSKIHEKVSKHLFSPLWKNYLPEELHIGGVTNGVHYPTWASKEWQVFAKNELKITSTEHTTEKGNWDKIADMSPEEIWGMRLRAKKKLTEEVKRRLDNNISLKNNPKRTINTINTINENALIIGFARRFVTYKRSGLLFTALDRLAAILNNPSRPVIFFFAGKAHPNDQESIRLIKQLIDASGNHDFNNSIIFIEDYNMDIARYLVQGVDIWLNTPNRHKEASGTSGMKAALNGVINFSVLDGWWAEAYNGNNGWALSEDPIYNDYELQNQLDAEIIYNTLEREIIPMYFERDGDQVPQRWIQKMKNSLLSIAPAFNMHRMLMEYNEKYYIPLFDRVNRLKSNNFALAESLSSWKRHVLSHWHEVDVISIEMPQKEKFKGLRGEKIKIKCVLDIGKLTMKDVGIEIVIKGGTLGEGCYSKEFTVVHLKGQEVTYECILRMEQTGTFDYSFRIFPKNENLPHRQDFDLVKWI
jgi:glycogen phosphorylase/synthase